MHKALSSIPGVVTGNQFDLLFPSLILKYVLHPFISVANNLMFRNFVQQDEIPGHKVGVYEELEEQQLSYAHFMGVVVAGLVYPKLGDNPVYMREACKINQYQLEFIKRVIVRNLYFRGKTATRYVGCPLNFAIDPEQFRAYFPNAKVVFCVRDPCNAVPSFVDLCATVSKDVVQPNGKYLDSFNARMHGLFKANAYNVYKNMARFEGDDECIWLDFENWKTQGVKELEFMWNELGWKTEPQASQAALHRSESHKNRKESFEVVSPEFIKREIGDDFKKCVEKCAAYYKKKGRN